MAKKKAIVADPKLVEEHEKEWVDAKPAEIRPLYEEKQVNYFYQQDINTRVV